MTTNFIELHPDRLDLPLAPCAVGRASSAVFTVGGDIPDDVETLSIKVEYMDGQNLASYVAAGDLRDDGSFRVYFAPAYFPVASESLKYHVIGTDSGGNPRWLGTGLLRILANPANGAAVPPSILPPASYAYNPATGLYHKIFAEVNDLGEITLSTEQEGVEL